MKSTIINISPKWGARVMLTKGTMTITRPVTASADNLNEAKLRMDYLLAHVWPGWDVTWLTKIEEVKP